MNNFQPVIGETIVSKVQGGAKQESRGAKHPLAPLKSAYAHRGPVSEITGSFAH